MKMREVLEKELEIISPTKDEILRLENFAKSFISSIEKKGVKAYVGGSLAKGTLIKKRGKQDIDIFVVFADGEELLKFESILGKIKLPGKIKKIHGSRDYFQIDWKEAVLEIVPVVKNRNPVLAENVTDVSLNHVAYLKREIKKNPSIVDEIRLAKAFCMAQGFYGAESYIRGFSGYSLEVLVVYFGSFVNFLKGISKKRVIDPEKYFRNEREVLHEINSSKLVGPLVLVDPTYQYRNVCAGLGRETFQIFLQVSRDFLKNPSLTFFEKRKIDIVEMKKFAKFRRARFVEVRLRSDRQEGDIAGTKMKKFFDFFGSELERKQQKVLTKEFDYGGVGNSANGYLVVEEKKEIEVRGPSVDLPNAVTAFKKSKDSKAFERKKFWWFVDSVSVEKIFKSIKKVEKEMGASGEIKCFDL